MRCAVVTSMKTSTSPCASVHFLQNNKQKKETMIGAIIGDIVGSRFEFNNTFNTNFDLFTKDCDFTDDTICTVAVADAILQNKSFEDSLLQWCRKYPNPMGAYGGSFNQWLHSDDPMPYNSFGNGSAMRVSPCAIAASSDAEAIRLAIASASCTHNHPEGIIGAVVTALVIRALSLNDNSNTLSALIEAEMIVTQYYGEDWQNQLPPIGKFDVTCQGCVPLAFFIVDNSHSFEDAIRKAVSYGGDSDTLAAIVGSMAEALWGVPDHLKNAAMSYLPDEMKNCINTFYEKYQTR